MQEFHASRLFGNATFLARLGQPFIERGRAPLGAEKFDVRAPIPDVLRQGLPTIIEKLDAECRTLHLKGCRATLEKIVLSLKDPTSILLMLQEDAAQFEERLVDELLDTTCFVLEGTDEQLFLGRNHFGEEIAVAFPGTIVDVEEAAKCLALGRGTACVFHLMRVLEVALQALAADLRIAKLDRNWQNLLNDIDKAVRALPYGTPPEKGYLAQRSEAAVHLRLVKDAWRNDTIHPRDSYTPEQARDVFDGSGRFMRSVAKFLKVSQASGAWVSP